MVNNNDAGFNADVTFVDMPENTGGADPLALFESESDPSRGGDRVALVSESDPSREGDRVALESKTVSPAASLARVRGPIALDQVVHRLGHVTWAEAVAIVEGLCGVLISGGRERVPEMSGVAITALGSVTAGSGGVNEAAGPILARMLHALAATGSVPAPLRLFVTKWASAGDGHPIAEFAKELAYFVRPDSRTLIQGVYDRAVATVPVQPKPLPPALKQIWPVRRPQLKGSRVLYAAAAAVVVLGISLTALFVWRGTGTARSGVTETETGLASAVPVTGTSPQDSAIQTAAGSQAPGVPTSGATARSARTSPALPDRAQVRTAGAPGPVSSAVRATLASPGAPAARPSPPLLLPTTGGAAPRSVLGATPARATRRDAPDAPIYSPSDSDVTPPVFLHPQLPAQLLSGLRPDMNTLELIVSEKGLVERVRLLSTPRRMPDMMLLSGAKNWEFEPALKDGQSVRYRLELSWAATP